MWRGAQRCCTLLIKRCAASAQRSDHTSSCLTSVVTRGLSRDARGYEHFAGRAHWYGFPAPSSGNQRHLWLAGGAAAVGGAYYLSSREEIPYVHRMHAIMFVSQDYEKIMGKALFEQEVKEAREKHLLLPPNHPYVRMVKRIGDRIAQVASDGYGGGKWSHMQGLAWEFAVIQSNMANAFVLPGGKVVVFSGLIDLLSGEDELAAVMAHEVSHVLARHQAERMSVMGVIAIGRMLLYLTFGVSLPPIATMLGAFLPFSRRAETEADVIGLRLMARACYDPGAATSMLSKLNAKEQQEEQRVGHIPAFMRTHPLTSERVARVKKELPAVYNLYHDSGCEDRQLLMRRALDRFFPEVVVHIPLEDM